MTRAWILVLFLVPQQSTPVDFDRDIRPIFKASCLKCHGAEGKPKGQFRLDLRAAAFRGGVGGKAIVPGKPDESPLYKLLVDPDDDARMPQKAPRLDAVRIALVKRWIEEGAIWPEDKAGNDATHWSLKLLARPTAAATVVNHLAQLLPDAAPTAPGA